MEILPESVPPEQWARLLEQMPWLEIPSSPLVRVIGVGVAVEVDGVRVELLAVEVRAKGAIVHWRGAATRDVALLMPEVSATDDQSTAYRVAPSQGGGGGRTWSGETMLQPVPPDGAMLHLEVSSFGPPPGMPPMFGYVPLPAVAGPWRFDVVMSAR